MFVSQFDVRGLKFVFLQQQCGFCFQSARLKMWKREEGGGKKPGGRVRGGKTRGAMREREDL